MFSTFSSIPDLTEFYLNSLPDTRTRCPTKIPFPILKQIVQLFESTSESLDVGAWCKLVEQKFDPGSPDSVWTSDFILFWPDKFSSELPSNEQVFIAHLAFLVTKTLPAEGKNYERRN